VNAPGTSSQASISARTRALAAHLFPPDATLNSFAVLDGASIPDLMAHLFADVRPEFECLYRGEVQPDVSKVAPYLVRLAPGTPFTDWLLASAWGRHWGIFALAAASLKELRTHFRTFLMVKGPDGKKLYFRFYDPRVLRMYLPTCNAQELNTVFGVTKTFLLEDEGPNVLLEFTNERGRLGAARTIIA
jgi:hypothetical protein